LENEVFEMLYRKINVEIIVAADEAEAVIGELNTAMDRLELTNTLYGGGIETVVVKHPGTRKRSALAHTIAAGETAIRASRAGLTVALRAIV
jgi:hypothetical protein